MQALSLFLKLLLKGVSHIIWIFHCNSIIIILRISYLVDQLTRILSCNCSHLHEKPQSQPIEPNWEGTKRKHKKRSPVLLITLSCSILVQKITDSLNGVSIILEAHCIDFRENKPRVCVRVCAPQQPPIIEKKGRK